MADDAYVGILDNFASELGSTLEDLVSDWTDADVEYAREIDSVARRSGAADSSRSSSFISQISMSSLDGMADLSLKKARPLYFANPVYDLINMDGTPSKQRQLTLIPLSQFDINKPKDESSKQSKKKRGSHGFINKLSHLTMRKHSMKKQESGMNVTAPLWTDVPSVKYPEGAQRSTSLKRTPSEMEEDESGQQQHKSREKQHRPHSLDIKEDNAKLGAKQPPEKSPRASKASNSPLTPKLDQFSPPAQADNNVFTESQPPDGTKVEVVALGVEPTKLDSLRSASSCGSLSSDLSEENNLDDLEQAKTMMEVMSEVGGDSAVDAAQMTQQKFEEKSDDQPLKRNKTLKWSGSRAAPALIREFTRKSRKNKQQEENIQVEGPTPGTSRENSPQKDSLDGANEGKAQPGGKELKVSKAEKLAMELSTSAPATPNLNRRDASAFTILSSLLPPAPKMKRTESSKIRLYIHRMGTNMQNALGYATSQFISQTINSAEYRPVVLLHSIRSFLTDIKRYLVSNPHVGFMAKIQKIVKNSAVGDVEGAIDDALERLVLYPLRDHIYKRLVIEYARSGKIKILEDAIKVAKSKTPKDLGIRETLIPPGDEAMEEINKSFLELQSTYSPFYKLKHLLSAVTTIYQNTTDLTCEDKSARNIGADDFLPLLVFAIVKCDFAAADIEAQYVDGLLDPTLLLGEGGYYLTTMISAVQVLSSMKRREATLPNISDLQGFLKVGISSRMERARDAEKSSEEKEQDVDADQTLLLHKTLHVPPSMTAHNLGMMIAKKYGMKNPKNYCLHVVVNGVAYPLRPQEFPQLVKMDLLTQFSASSFYFIYRQLEEAAEHTVSPKRPVTIDTEHLKINTEDGMETLTAAAEIVKSVVSEQKPSEDVYSFAEEATQKDAHIPPPQVKDVAPPEVNELSVANVNDLPLPEVTDLPPPDVNELSVAKVNDLPLPEVTDFPPPEVDDLPPPQVSDLTQPEVTDLPPPDAEVADVPAHVDDLPSPDELMSPQKGLTNKNIDLVVTPYDSEEEIPPFLETYESGDRVDVDIATGATSATTATISNSTRNNNNQGMVASVVERKHGGVQIATSVPTVPSSSCVPTAPSAEQKQSNDLLHPPFPSPPDEDSVSDNASDYDNLHDSQEALVELEPTGEPTPITGATAGAGNGEKTLETTDDASVSEPSDSRGRNATPSVTITDLCASSDPNNNAHRLDDKMSEASDISSCHSEGYLVSSISDGRHSRGYHSDGCQIDEVFNHNQTRTDHGANASVTRLKLYFEEKIVEVAHAAMTTHT